MNLSPIDSSVSDAKINNILVPKVRFFLGRQFVASISRLLEKLETRAIAYSNREKKCVAYKENFLRR